MIAADPLFAPGGVGLAVVVIVVARVLVAFGLLMVSVMAMVWFERKLISDMQNRIGPNRAGPWGILQALADGIKLFFKEDLTPQKADRFVFKLAPFLSVIPAICVFGIVPVGGVVTIAHHSFELQVADPPMGILFLLAMSSVSVYGVMLAGWSSGSKYPLIGSVRASAQMVSYEAAMSLSIAAVVLVTVAGGGSESLSTFGIVAGQAQHVWYWNILRTGVVPFILFAIAGTAELNRPPFDLVEAEQELVGGFFTEYSSIRFALFYLAEYMNTITMSAIMVTLFFGGPDGPGFHTLRWLWPILWFAGKTFVFLFVFVWVRATLPRLRYDQLMDLGWKVLIPASLGWLLLLAAMRLPNGTRTEIVSGVILFVACMAAWALLARAVAVGRRRSGHVGARPAGAAAGRFDVVGADIAGGRIVPLPGRAAGHEGGS